MGGNIRDSKCQETPMETAKLLNSWLVLISVFAWHQNACADGKGIHPISSKVVITQIAGATETYRAQPEKVAKLVEKGLLLLTRSSDTKAAWRTLVSSADIVAIKVYSSPGSQSGTRPSVVEAL